jgi:RNA polymerase sigma-70 factor (ECF subfamily)
MVLDVEALFRQHHVQLFRYLLQLTGDAELAADATQEAFVRMIEKQPEGKHPRAWLYTVATNYARESTRSHSNRARLAEGAVARITPDADRSPEDLLSAAGAVARVRAALAQLPARDRTVLLMREEGFAHREIAQAVGTTTGSVGTIIARALDRLAIALDLDPKPAT